MFIVIVSDQTGREGWMIVNTVTCPLSSLQTSEGERERSVHVIKESRIRFMDVYNELSDGDRTFFFLLRP